MGEAHIIEHNMNEALDGSCKYPSSKVGSIHGTCFHIYQGGAGSGLAEKNCGEQETLVLSFPGASTHTTTMATLPMFTGASQSGAGMVIAIMPLAARNITVTEERTLLAKKEHTQQPARERGILSRQLEETRLGLLSALCTKELNVECCASKPNASSAWSARRVVTALKDVKESLRTIAPTALEVCRPARKQKFGMTPSSMANVL